MILTPSSDLQSPAYAGVIQSIAPGSLAASLGLRQMTDEALYVLAAMLPEHRRGYYADLSKATMETIEGG